MADPSRPGVFNPLLPARIFAPVFALGALVFLLAAGVLALSARGAEPTVLARGQEGRLTLPDVPRAPAFTLYGATATGARPADPGCRLTSRTRTFVEFDATGRSRDVEGSRLFRVGRVSRDWDPADVITCNDTRALVALTEGPGAG